jgi:hypothetical protein
VACTGAPPLRSTTRQHPDHLKDTTHGRRHDGVTAQSDRDGLAQLPVVVDHQHRHVPGMLRRKVSPWSV